MKIYLSQKHHIIIVRRVTIYLQKQILVIGFDETIESRRGERIKAKGIYRDAVRSSKSFFVKCVPRGLRWLSFMLLTEVAFAQKVWALPFLTVLCPSERYDEERGIRHRKLTDRARQAIFLIKRWLPDLDLVFVGDSSFAALDLLNSVRDGNVFADYDDGTRTKQRRKTASQKRNLVSQRVSDIFRCDRMREATNMGV